jgi:hypothetical protein
MEPAMLRRSAIRRWGMADAGLFIGWGEVVRGRETEALEVFNETLAYYGRLQEEGEIENFEPVFLEPHGGDLNGFILIRGDAGKLASLRWSEEFTQFATRATLVVEGFGIVGADLAERLQRQMEYYTEQIGAFA